MAKERLGADRWKALSEKERRAEMRVDRERWQAEHVGQVPAKTSYEEWLRKQPADFAREVLGEGKFRAWRRGLSVESMATYDRPLSIAELKRMYPEYW